MRCDTGDKGHQQRRYYSPRRDSARPSVGGSPASNGVGDEEESGRILGPASLMHSKSPSQISSSGSSSVITNDSGGGAQSPPKMAHREFVYGKANSNNFTSNGNRSFYETAHESINNRYGSGKLETLIAFRRSASSENFIVEHKIAVGMNATSPSPLTESSYYHSTALVSSPDTSPTHGHRQSVGSYRYIKHIDEDEDSMATRIGQGPPQNQKLANGSRGRYQRHQHKTAAPTQSSIRRKFHHVSADVAPARSLPDLSAKEPFRNENDANIRNEEENASSSYLIAQWPAAGHKVSLSLGSTLYYLLHESAWRTGHHLLVSVGVVSRAHGKYFSACVIGS